MPGPYLTIKYRLQPLFIVILSIIFPFFLPAQGYPDPTNWQVERMDIQEETGRNGVKAMTEDHQGYLWLGINIGISRYDGYNFKNYHAIPGDSTSLNHGRTSAAFTDYTGLVWVGTRLGLNRYIPECDCFKQYNTDSAPANTVPDGEINWIAEDRDSNMWVVSQNGGLYRYKRASDSFERFLYRPKDPVNLSEDQARALLCDKDGFIWVGTGETFVPSIKGGGLIRFDPKSGEAKRYLHDPENDNSLIDDRVSALLQDSKGRIWVGTCQSGVHLYDPEKDHFIRITADDGLIYAKAAGIAPWSACPHIRALHEDKWGGIWVGNFNGGIYRFDATGGPPKLFEYQEDNPQSLGSNLIWSFFEDSQGRFWTGQMSGDGFAKIDPFQNKFKTWFLGENISAIYEAPSEPGIFWIGMWEKGLIRWDRKTGDYQQFQVSAISSKGPSSNVISRFFEDKDQQFWVITNQGINRLDRASNTFTHYPIGWEETEGEEVVGFMDILEDKDGIIWLGSWGSGLYRFDKYTGAYKKYPLPYKSGDEGNTYNQSVYTLFEDSQGRLWLGTWMEGLYLFDRKTAQFTQYLPGVGVNKIHEIASDRFWLTSETDGLLEFSPDQGIIRSFSIESGVPGKSVLSMTQANNLQLWLGTSNGLCVFDPQKETVITYNKSDGLPELEFGLFGALTASDGTLFFGTGGGLISFNPDRIFSHPEPPKMQINDIRIFDKSLVKGEVDSSHSILSRLPEKLKLPYWQKELTFEYVGLHFTHPDLNQYRHRLIPYEKAWIEAENKREARYTNLSPGNYRFEVIASNSDGLWATIPATIDILILPPWWQTWWSYLLYAVTIALILYTAYRYQKRRWALQANLEMEQEKSQRLAEMDEFKSRFYANVTHEFRTPLTVIKGLTNQIRENPRWKTTEQLNLIERNSDKLLNLINQMLDLSRLEAGKLKPKYVQGDIIQYLAYLIESFHSLAFTNKISISFHAEVDQLLMDYDPDKCQQVLSNLVSNAIKFTPEYGKIKVTAKTLEQAEGKQLEVKVQDTGTGIPEDKLPFIFDRFYQADNSTSRKAEGTGIGLALVKELLELMGGHIQIQSQVDKGTTVTFQLPVHNQAKLVENGFTASIPSPPPPSATFIEEKQNQLKTEELPLVLIVEDNPDVIYYLRSCLEGQYQITETRNGQDGLSKAQEMIPDIVISDVMMPEMDGFELCQALKTDQLTNHIPVILLTAKVTQEDKMEGLTQGADAYLTKPFQKEELLVRANNLIEIRKQLQAHFLNDNGADTETSEDPFLTKFREIVKEHLDDADFNVAQLSRALGISRVQVHRKLKALTDLSITQYIRLLRLNKARKLLKNPDLTIAEVAYQVGFKDPSHFSKVFAQHFGESPSVTRK